MQSFLKQYESIPVKEELNHVAKDPLVSVAVQTYQHAPYIVQCLDGVLMQKTTFPVEILLGEDDSSDGTREICLEYAQKYPDKIRLFLHHRENNIKIGGKPTGRFNLLYNFSQARGKYIALCEGDDYWTDPLKLQKQVDLLEAHPEYSMCFHNVQRIYEDAVSKLTLFNPPFAKKEYKLKDLLKGNFIHTSSVVYRNKLFGKYPDWYYKVAVGDWPLFLLNAQYGNIGYIPKVMSVYRIHNGGIHSPRTRISNSQEMIKIYQNLNSHFKFKYNSIVQSGIYLHQYYIAKDSKKWRQALQNLCKCILVSPFEHAFTFRRLFGVVQYYLNRLV